MRTRTGRSVIGDMAPLVARDSVSLQCVVLSLREAGSRPSPPIPAAGDQVRVASHGAFDLAGVRSELVDELAITARGADFVREGPAKGGHYLYWANACVFMTYDDAGTPDLPDDQTFAALD